MKVYLGNACNTAGVEIKYENTDTDFKIEFLRIDRNKPPLSGQENGRINDHISDLEQAVLSYFREETSYSHYDRTTFVMFYLCVRSRFKRK